MTKRAMVSLLAVLLLAGCPENGGGTGGGAGGGLGGGVGGGGGSGGGNPDMQHSTGGSSWTVLVYMTADNDLEPFALQDLTEMMQVGSAQGFNLVVQVDRAVGYSEDPIGGLPNFTTTKRVLVQQGSLAEISDLGELDMADPNTLADFITWGIGAYPADRTALFMWDHGGGWLGFGLDEGSGGNLLSLPQIVQGMQQGLAGANNHKPFNIVGFDACLMATYEVSASLEPHAEYLVASEEVEPGHGWDWTAMATLAQNPSADPIALGHSIVDGFKNQATQANTVDQVTLALIDLYRMGTMSNAVNAVINSFTGAPSALTTAFGRGQSQSLKFGDAPDPSRATNMVDLLDVVTLSAQAGQNQALSGAQQQLQAGIGQSVLYSFAGAARAKATGMSIYFPPDSRYYGNKYDQIQAAAQWRSFLQSYFNGGASATTPVFTNPNKVATTSTDGQGNWILQGDLQPGTESSVARATLLYGVVNGTQLIVLGDSPAGVNGTAVSSSWDFTAVTLAQGTNQAFAYGNIVQTDATHLALNVMLQYQQSSSAQPQDAIRQLVVDISGTPTLTSDTYYVDTNGTFGQLSPVVGSTLNPVLIAIDSNTNQTSYVLGTSTPFTPVQGTSGLIFDLKLAFQKVTSGTSVFGFVNAQNAAGNGDTVYATTTVP